MVQVTIDSGDHPKFEFNSESFHAAHSLVRYRVGSYKMSSSLKQQFSKSAGYLYTIYQAVLLYCLISQSLALNYAWIEKSNVDGLTDKEKKFLVDVHNHYRRVVSTKGLNNKGESAANMRELTWSDKLATAAQRWSAKCRYTLDQRISHINYPHSARYRGENIHLQMELKSIFKKAMVGWADYEDDLYKFGKKYHRFNAHYTQIMWARSSEIGCGFSMCTGADYRHLVCIYMPPGNKVVNGRYLPIFERGSQCTKCDPGYGFCKQKLCAKSCEGSDCWCTVNYHACLRNKGTYDQRSCFCHCPRGRKGLNCEKNCEDTTLACKKQDCVAGSRDYAFNEETCAYTCGKCEKRDELKKCIDRRRKCKHLMKYNNCRTLPMTVLCCRACKQLEIDARKCFASGGWFHIDSYSCRCYTVGSSCIYLQPKSK